MIDPEWLKEREEATNRLFARIESQPGYSEVLAEVRAEHEKLREAEKVRRLKRMQRAKVAASARWDGHSSVEWTTVRIPSSLAAGIREIYPRLAFGKAIQRLLDFRRRASL